MGYDINDFNPSVQAQIERKTGKKAGKGSKGSESDSRPSVIKFEAYIGIDPGQTTGIAVWDATIKEFEELMSGPFWSMWRAVMRYHNKAACVVLEDPNQNKPVFPRPGAGIKEILNIGQKVGMNKRDAQIWYEGLQSAGYTVNLVRPTGKKGQKRKMDADQFMRMTGLGHGYNEHIRDAAMMVYMR